MTSGMRPSGTIVARSMALVVLMWAGSACGGSGGTGPSVVVTAVSVEGGRDTLYVGQSMALSAAVQLDSTTVIHTDTVAWTSSDTTRATVSAAGAVMARAAGTATITASLGGHSGHRDILVAIIPVASITVSPGSRILYLGQIGQLASVVKDSAGTPITGQHPAWTSSNASVASVDSLGKVTAHDTGTARVRATLAGHADSAAVTVTIVPVTSVQVLPAGDTAVVGDTIRPVAIPEDSSGAPLAGRAVSWAVSDSAALSPTGDGGYVALSAGIFTLTASSGGVSHLGTILTVACGDTVQVAGNAFQFPLVSGQLARGLSSTIDVGSVSHIPVFYGGGVMFGTDSAHMVVAYDPRGDVGDGATHAGVCVLDDGSGVMYTYSKVRPVAGEGAPAGLRVVQETFAIPAAADSDFVLFRYTFTDTAATAVTGLRIGYFVDWDLNFDGDPSMDDLRYYAGLGYAEAEESDTVTYPQRLGIVPISASGTPSYSGWINGGMPDDPSTRGAYYGRLVAGTTTANLGPQDIRQLVGTGPYTIPARGHLVVYFAMVEGGAQSMFAANRAAAIALATMFGFN
ncbi:MAG: Ig-like domain-containing protein [Gemmatimonadales bacterium]